MKSASAFVLYIYLASNADGFTKALSPTAIKEEIGMAPSTYHDQFHKLVDMGYLVDKGGNRYDFYEMPHDRKIELQKADSKSNTWDDGLDFENDLNTVCCVRKTINGTPQEDIEINNINSGTDNEVINKEKNIVDEAVKKKTYSIRGFVF